MKMCIVGQLEDVLLTQITKKKELQSWCYDEVKKKEKEKLRQVFDFLIVLKRRVCVYVRERVCVCV